MGKWTIFLVIGSLLICNSGWGLRNGDLSPPSTVTAPTPPATTNTNGCTGQAGCQDVPTKDQAANAKACVPITTLDAGACKSAGVAAVAACENPISAFSDSGGLGRATAGSGINNSMLLNVAGGMGATMAASSAGTDIQSQCNAMKKVAENMRDMQMAYTAACTAAMGTCMYMCSGMGDSLRKMATEISELSSWKSGDPPLASATCNPGFKATDYSHAADYRTAAETADQYEKKCTGFTGTMMQSAQQALQYQQSIAATNATCQAITQPCTAANSYLDPNCVQTCANPQFAATNSYCQSLATGPDCSVAANAGAPACVCKYNPNDPSCGGNLNNALAGAKPVGGFDPTSDLNTQGPEFNKQGDPKNGIGNATGGQAQGGGLGGGAKNGGLAGNSGGPKGGAGSGVDTNIDRGMRGGGGYSVSGVPLSGGGGGGNGNGNGKEKVDLSKYLPKGTGKEAFRSLAGMQTTGADGITCANCAEIWTKVNNQYNRQRPALRP